MPAIMQACIDAGGLALAAPLQAGEALGPLTKPPDHVVSDEPSLVWIGAAYVHSHGTAELASGAANGWMWIAGVEQAEDGEPSVHQGSLHPVTFLNWAAGFPHLLGADHVNLDAGSAIKSCVAMQWPPHQHGFLFKNVNCESQHVHHFVRLHTCLSPALFQPVKLQHQAECPGQALGHVECYSLHPHVCDSVSIQQPGVIDSIITSIPGQCVLGLPR